MEEINIPSAQRNEISCAPEVLELPSEMRTKCEVFSRVVGYYRPVSNWNKGKAAEFKERKEFNEKTCLCSQFATSNKPNAEPIKH